MSERYRVWQFFSALRARVGPEESSAVEQYLNPALVDLFFTMRESDQRHALNVLYRLRAAGHDDPHLLAAALLHDVGKSRARVGLLTRSAVVLLRKIDRRLVARLASADGSGWRHAFYVQLHHPAIGARLVAEVGGTPEVIQLVAQHEVTPEDRLARALFDADGEN